MVRKNNLQGLVLDVHRPRMTQDEAHHMLGIFRLIDREIADYMRWKQGNGVKS